MENFDLELTSEESGKIDIQSHSKPYQGRVREITKSGNLYIDPGEIWEYWNVLKSENLFERLFLDITLQDMITNEKVTNHYNQIKNYLARWREREGSGINFSSSHNGYSVSELERYLEDAFISLKNVQGRVDYYASWKRKADSDAYEKLAPYILTAIEDKILSFTEKRLIFTEGQKLGLTNDQIAEEINKYKRIRGDVKDETESENKLPAIIMTKEDAYNLFSVSKDASEQEIEESYHILRDSYITGLNSSIENIRTRSKIKLEEIDYAFSLIQKARKEMVHENEPLLPVKPGQAKKQVAKLK